MTTFASVFAALKPVLVGFVVEESADRAPNSGAEMIVVRLVDGSEEPIDAILARRQR